MTPPTVRVPPSALPALAPPRQGPPCSQLTGAAAAAAPEPKVTCSMRTTKMTAGLSRLLAAMVLALGVLGLALSASLPAASAATAATAHHHAKSGWLRLAHLSPNTPAVDVYLYSFGNPSAKIVLHHVAYGTVSAYQEVPVGEYTVAMRGAGAAARSKPVLSTSVSISAGGAYTVAGMGPASGLRLQVLTDRLATPKGRALVRVIQASMHQHRVSVRLAGRGLARQLAFSRVSSYRAVAPGTLTVHAFGSSESTTETVHLTAGSIHTLVVLDGASTLAVDDLIDAEGSKVMPAGAAQTGFGGTAPRPGAPLLPWVGAAALGLLASAGGAVVVSRRRRPALHAR
jgi:Domain of unknown function (DUF4397)